MSDTDALLQRIERRAAVLGVAAAGAAWLWPGGGARLAAGVLGGAFVSGLSYWAIKRGVTGIADAVIARPAPAEGAAPPPRSAVRGLAAIIGRYALLAGIAYVMIARLRLPPLGLLGGASVIPVSAALELVRRRR